jgi:uncharacterized protein YcbK (DUF882 family)
MSKYFSEDELACQHCGEHKFDEAFLTKLDAIREECGFPFPVTSGYRCEEHPIEARKIEQGRPRGAHTYGKAIDIGVSGERAGKLLEVAMKHGIKRIGVNQKGNSRFIHLDVCDFEMPSPALWSY